MRAVVRAPAKLTWSLRVTGVRPDGYHLIDAEMAELDLADELIIENADRNELIIEGGGRLSAGADNLVVRALEQAGRRARVTLVKRIPAGAGLGGGSADAAAVLRWAGISDPQQAVRLGADVAFCLIGGRARVRGIGEQIEPLDPLRRELTLITPPFAVSTPAVYRAWDELGGPQHEINDLTAAALTVRPELARWRDELGEATGEQPILAGSGGTWFVPGAHRGVVIEGVPALVAVSA